jgi:hypothetical protein
MRWPAGLGRVPLHHLDERFDRRSEAKLIATSSISFNAGVKIGAGKAVAVVLFLFTALLSFRGIGTPSRQAPGEQRRPSFFNNRRDIPVRIDGGPKGVLGLPIAIGKKSSVAFLQHKNNFPRCLPISTLTEQQFAVSNRRIKMCRIGAGRGQLVWPFLRGLC